MPVPNCPACGSVMKLRRSSFGEFFGCSNYPRCRKTVKVEAAAAAPAAAPVSDDGLIETVDNAPSVPASNGTRYGGLMLPASPEAARAAHDALCARLDADQQRVAAWTPAAGNVRVVAAAGSGKTTTTVALVGRLLWSALLTAGEIIATTFTRKAADELVARLVAVIPPGAFDPSSPGREGTLRVGTFHALALQTLRRRDSRWNMNRCLNGGSRAAGVPTEAALWGKILGYAGPEGVPGLGVEGLGLEEPDLKSYMLAVDCARSQGLRGTALAAELRRVERESGLPFLVRAHETVERAKDSLSAFTFGDILSAYLDGLRDGSITDGARLVIVDEAQDNSAEQIEIAPLLAKNGSGHVILVGDVRQAIYEWRGAAPELMQQADKGLGAATWEMTHNYRSVPAVVALGNRVSEGKAWSLGAASVAARTDAGHVTVSGYADPGSEAAGIARSIQSALDEGSKLTVDGRPQFAVLVRTNAAAGCIEAAMVSAKIPAVVVGGTPFFSRREVLDVLAYVKLASGANDMEAFGRIVNRPRRYLGKAFTAKVAAAGGARDLLNAIDDATESLYPKQRGSARDLRVFISELRAAEWPTQVEMVAKLLAPDDAATGEADADRSGIPAAVADVGRGFASAGEFLAFVARCQGEVVEAKGSEGQGFEIPEGRVVISTVHKAKGLEWETVYVSASETVFPHRRATSPRARAGEERLFYVACTRAKTFLHCTWAEVNLFGKPAGPSPFLAYVEQDETPEPPPGGGRPNYEAQEIAAALALNGAIESLKAQGAQIVDEGSSDVGVVLTKPEVKDSAAGLRVLPFAGLSGVETAAPSATLPEEKLFGQGWAAVKDLAYKATSVTPKATDGGRYVQPTAEDFAQLLLPLGFVSASSEVAMKANQRVLEFGHDAAGGEFIVRVYTSVALGENGAREVGEDSIKVAALWLEAGTDRPWTLHKKMPYAMRTRSWRLAVLDKIAEVVGIIDEASAHRCRKCGAPTVARQKAGGGTSFRGCVRYPDCK